MRYIDVLGFSSFLIAVPEEFSLLPSIIEERSRGSLGSAFGFEPGDTVLLQVRMVHAP